MDDSERHRLGDYCQRCYPKNYFLSMTAKPLKARRRGRNAPPYGRRVHARQKHHRSTNLSALRSSERKQHQNKTDKQIGLFNNQVNLYQGSHG